MSSKFFRIGLGILSLIAISFTSFRYGPWKVKPAETDKVGRLKVPAGFKAEHLFSPSEANLGSWVSMTFDDKGRMICSDQYGGIFRLTIPKIGDNTKTTVERLKIGLSANDTLGYAHGLLYAFNSLYVMINNAPYNKSFLKKSGLYRLQDLDGDGSFEKLSILKEMVGDGEHGPHSIALSPDGKSLFVICGNYTDPPKMDTYAVNVKWKEDNLFPLIKDPRGHANDRYAPGGWVANIDPEGKTWRMVSSGYRNPFDLAFNEVGDLFVYDADMEWDFGMPWYRPTRICHAVSGSEFGWRNGNSKWSPSWPDNLSPVINIGQGSPTNLMSLKNSKFPEKYRKSLLAFDWSFGIMHLINLKPEGSTYTADREEFVSGLPMPLTDGVFGPDGALYFLTGGRKLESDLFRVSYTGTEKTEVNLSNLASNPTQTRRKLEELHSLNTDPISAANTAWPYLKSTDRFIQYAARMVLEHQPSATWATKAMQEKDPSTLIQGMLALIRSNEPTYKSGIEKSLASVNFKALDETQKINLLRAVELCILRFGGIDAPSKATLINNINPAYPATSPLLNRSLSKILIALEAPKVVDRTVALLYGNEILNEAVATNTADLIFRNPQYGIDLANLLSKIPPAQQTYYAVMLSMAKTGWSPELYDKYFKWYVKAFSYKGGNSYIGFLEKSRKMALAHVPENKKTYYDKLSGADLIGKNGNDLANVISPKGPWTQWTLDKAITHMDSLQGRSYENGKNMYLSATCNTCHSMRGEGGAVGPELTQLGTRFTPKDMLEAIIEPNKTISDQYAVTAFSMKNGTTIVGKLISQDQNKYVISQNPFAPDVLTNVLKKNVVEAKTSGVSIMYSGLVNGMGKNELRDLVAFLMAGGNEKHELYGKK
jgi:putative heme-binding domain-containing protein